MAAVDVEPDVPQFGLWCLRGQLIVGRQAVVIVCRLQYAGEPAPVVDHLPVPLRRAADAPDRAAVFVVGIVVVEAPDQRDFGVVDQFEPGNIGQLRGQRAQVVPRTPGDRIRICLLLQRRSSDPAQRTVRQQRQDRKEPAVVGEIRRGRLPPFEADRLRLVAVLVVLVLLCAGLSFPVGCALTARGGGLCPPP